MNLGLKTVSMSGLTVLFGVASALSSEFSLSDFFSFAFEPLNPASWLPLLLLVPA